MSMTASLIKSLASIVFYLRHLAQANDYIIIDEPELNLHPDNQILIARFLGSLVNQGFKVIASTHSDYLVMEISNLIMLGSANEKTADLIKQYGYVENQLLKHDRVGAWLFNENDENCAVRYRSLGKTKVKGKLLAVKIIEIFWQKDESQVTRISTALDLKLPESDFSMELDINGRKIKMTENSPNKVIGRGEECDIQILAPMASRLHAEIQFSDGNFKIVDQSTNGTWLEIGGNSLRLHRDKTVLLGKGQISLGSADFSDPSIVIKFEI